MTTDFNVGKAEITATIVVHQLTEANATATPTEHLLLLDAIRDAEQLRSRLSAIHHAMESSQ